jgi:transcriptional regulator with XRE-family HTH domain
MCHDDVLEWAAEGMSKTEIAVKLGVARSTMYEWMEKHEEFRDIIKRAEQIAEAWYVRTFREMSMGKIKGAQPVALIFNAKNQLPDVFRDRKQLELDAEIGVFEIDFLGYQDDDESTD